jgi:hypothetical protein
LPELSPSAGSLSSRAIFLRLISSALEISFAQQTSSALEISSLQRISCAARISSSLSF